MNKDPQVLITESRNPNSLNLDQMSALEIVTLMNREEEQVNRAVAAQLPVIAAAVEQIERAFRAGGRLFYIGAGSSGRLGVLDASECPPTFGTPETQVQGILAGGDYALRHAVENVEDDTEQGALDLLQRDPTGRDVVCGIAASGLTPYVLGAMRAARHQQAVTLCITCNADSPLAKMVDYAITPVVGPEILMGSSRLKAGSAQKQILNMLTTAAFSRSGKVYSNLMVDLQPTNAKLLRRANRIVCLATNCSEETAQAALSAAKNQAKTAIVMILAQVDAAEAERRLSAANGFIAAALL
ncbi:MAG: N-acetylmuramic acid 6-phosphate etherase [Negativicutes bacterium]|nr:N-acetylmuramic acid 6-phosphate etherase [Negativicutes bacterium]